MNYMHHPYLQDLGIDSTCRAARVVANRPTVDILDISRTDTVHQSLILSLLRVAIRPIYSLFTLGSSGDPGESLSAVMARKAPHSKAADDGHFVTPLRPVDSSRTGFIACYFYLYVVLRDKVDSFIHHWFIEQLLVDARRTQAPMQKGQYCQPLWFWTVMFGACVVSAGQTNSRLEEAQMNLAKQEYFEKISLASQVLKIKNWEGAKSALSLFAWEDDFDGEPELKALWEEAVWAGNNRETDGTGDEDLCHTRVFW